MIIVLMTLFVTFYVIAFGSKGGFIGVLMGVAYPIFLIFYWFPEARKSMNRIREIAYDKENLYVKEGDYEIQIPFHDVKDIEIMSLDGLYKFKLYHHDQFGDEVICKPSLWYPFNYKKIDAELNRIRSFVRKAHREYKDKIGSDMSLPSN